MNLALKDIQHNLGRFVLTTIGVGIAFFAVADAEAIQFDSSGEAVRLERSARTSRGQRSELGTKQPSLVEQASKPSGELPAIARPQISAVMVRVAHEHGTGVIVVTHDHRALNVFDTLYEMEDGVIRLKQSVVLTT